MLKGAIAKRFYYVISALCRFLSFLGLLIAYIVVRVTVKPQIGWLNILLLVLSILSLLTGLFNLLLCGSTATGYKQNFVIQFVCFIVTVFTGGIVSSALTGVAVFTKVLDDEVENEKIINVKTFKNKDVK